MTKLHVHRAHETQSLMRPRLLTEQSDGDLLQSIAEQLHDLNRQRV